jgi:hypothetical protein
LAAFAAPLGDLFGIPSIVQAKFWSDVVAGLIEGGSKYAQILNLQKRDVAEILPRIGEEKAEDRYAAILDFLKLFRDQPRSRTSLRKLFRDETDSSCRRLCHTLSEPKVYTELIDYILGETPQDSKASLVSLTAETFPVFRDWVLAHEQELPSTRAEKNNPASL